MDFSALIVTRLIGAVAGWIVGQIVKGIGFGLAGSIILLLIIRVVKRA